MGRLTERNPVWIDDEFWTAAREPYDDEITDVYLKLREYENTGLTPAEVAELAQAKKDGLLVWLSEPRLPLVWGDHYHCTILCPNCGHDLMGGFPDGDDDITMCQCRFCGQLIDELNAVEPEAQAALDRMEG